MLWHPLTNTRLRLIGDDSQFDDRCCAYQPLFVSDAATTAPIALGVHGDYVGYTPPGPGIHTTSPSDPANAGVLYNPFNRITYQDTESRETTSDKGVSLQLDQGIGDLTFTAIGGYRQNHSLSRVDADGTNSAVLNISSGTDSTITEKSLETRLQNATGSQIEFVLGTYLFDQSIKSRYLVPVTIKSVGAVLDLDDTSGTETSKSAAGFGQVTYNLTDAIRLTGGLRYLTENKSADITSAAGSATFGGNFGRNDNALMGNAVLAYHPAPTMNFYLRYARGFKSGGINLIVTESPTVASPSVGPETTDAYEAGAKLSFFDKKVDFDLAVFTETINNQQVSSYVASAETFIAQNAAKARSRGVETELRAHPFGPLTLSLDVNYLDSRFVSFPDAPPPAGSPSTFQDLTGRPTSNAPRWTEIASVSFEQPLSDAVRLLSTVSLREATSYYVDVPDTQAFRNGSTSFLDAHVELALKGGVGIQFWGRNLTQQNAYTTGIGSGGANGSILAFINDPRTYGVTLHYRY